VAARDRPILVVEDDDTIRSALQMALDAYGYAVRLAADGREAIALIEGEPPSLVILDMHMPTLDGWEFMRELGARGIDPPIVVMTANVDAARLAEELGAAGFLGKPFDLNDLVSVVARCRVP